jgi:phospholipase/carboxylesterase
LALFGAPVDAARAVVILLHGRAQTPAEMEEHIVRRLDLPDAAYLAPAAAERSWYPARFMEPRAANEPQLGLALAQVAALSDELQAAGVPHAAQVLMGFSQGACLACEYVYRRRRRFGALVAFTGGLIGPEGTSWTPEPAAWRGMPVLLGGGGDDPWVPAGRMMETARLFERSGARVALTVYPSAEHLVRDEQIAAARALLAELPAPRAAAATASR